jgi:hypothetical protein
MTAQISDTFIFRGEAYSLIGIEGGELISPEHFGMRPEMLHTACYATYELTETGLYLRELTLCEKDGNYLPINGVLPEKENYQASYYNLSVLVSFTGRIRLAKDFIKESYIHMGYQRPTAFNTVYDITFHNGRVVELKDRSQDMKRQRGLMKGLFRNLRRLLRREEPITKAFSLDMDKE